MSKVGKAFGGKSVLAIAKGILNKLPSGLTATVPTRAVDAEAGARATRVTDLGAATVGAIAGAGGVFIGRGTATDFGDTTAGFGSAGGNATGVSVFGVVASFANGRGFGRLTIFIFGSAGTFEAIFDGRLSFDFGTAPGFTTCDFTLSIGFLDWVGRFSCVINAGAGGVMARVGSNAVGIVGRIEIPRVLVKLGDLESFTLLGRFSLDRGIWRGGLAK